MSNMSNNNIETIINNAIIDGHFVLSGGRHSDKYIEKFKWIEDPAKLVYIVSELIQKVEESGFDLRNGGIDAVVAPTTGGGFIGWEAARQLKVKSILAEESAGNAKETFYGRIIKRKYDFFKDWPIVGSPPSVMVLDDICSSGHSILDTCYEVDREGWKLVCAAVIVNKDPKGEFPWPMVSLAERPDIRSWEPEECHMCFNGMRITNE